MTDRLRRIKGPPVTVGSFLHRDHVAEFRKTDGNKWQSGDFERLVSVPMEPTACPDGSALLAIPGRQAGVAMKWILVVLVGGMTPIQTDLKFDKLADCLDAEEQLRTTYAEAYAAWDKGAANGIERRRDYRRAREFQDRRLANTGTCIPHAGTDQVVTVPKSSEPPATAPAQNPAR